jgi:hypothetical protein
MRSTVRSGRRDAAPARLQTGVPGDGEAKPQENARIGGMEALRRALEQAWPPPSR